MCCWEGGEKQPTQENGEILLFLELLALASESTGICVRFFYFFFFTIITLTSGSLAFGFRLIVFS